MKVLSLFVAILAVAAARVNPSPQLWSLQELDAALANPQTPDSLKPYLIDALNNLMESMFSGSSQSAIPVITPAGVLPAPTEVAVVPEAPTPDIAVFPIAPAPVAPVAPVAEPVAPAASGGSAPLVQLIVNINAEQQQAIKPSPVVESPVPEAVVPTPVAVVDQPSVIPTPVAVVEQPEIISPVEVINPPSPVEVIPAPAPINPIDVIAISPPSLNPIDVIAISPPELNPIDVIAISPPELNPIDVIAISPPEINPIDVIAPVPVVSGNDDGKRE